MNTQKFSSPQFQKFSNSKDFKSSFSDFPNSFTTPKTLNLSNTLETSLKNNTLIRDPKSNSDYFKVYARIKTLNTNSNPEGQSKNSEKIVSKLNEQTVYF